ncbi:hypothetical protein BJD20_17820 [Acinetobacter proteolyticus]|uniref:hypothetical protein n=1 Tax=Acinetobacter proteolyticus TaxID=1776741 RepID=UPI00086337A5|nr:hypothetical protein [Acinetobacter proteolyticus]OEY94905.1 hypothetical protein BJD20_17820 [Acinetobacter proteolyticus]
MTEVVSAGAGIAAVIKSYGVFFIVVMALTFMFLAWMVVIMTRLPKTRREWVVSLISTAVGSIAGGAFVIQHFGLQAWSENAYGAFALGGLYFLCGLPVWAIIRWTFNYINAREDSTILDVAKEVKDFKDKF